MPDRIIPDWIMEALQALRDGWPEGAVHSRGELERILEKLQ